MSQAFGRASNVSMRIIALPLSTGARSNGGQYTYYHFQTPPVSPSKVGPPSFFKRSTDKAAELWAGFGKAPEGHWKHRTFKFGQRLIDRVDFEELALKSIDPSLGPKAHKFGQSDVKIDEKGPLPSIPLLHPTLLAAKESPVTHLQALLSKRIPLHRKGFYTWLIIAPLTTPFAIIPVIPNLPFFFSAWRCWSHWKALKASEYLDSLVKHGAVVPESSPGLDEIYASYPAPPEPPNPSNSPSVSEASPSSPSETETANTTTSEAQFPPDARDRVLIDRTAIPHIVTLFDLPSSAASDLYRALDQTAARLAKH